MRAPDRYDAFVFVVVVMVVLSLYWNFSVWRECRATNSWAYCARLVTR